MKIINNDEVESMKKQILLVALYNISQIKNKDNGGDWDEIEEARKIAKDAINKYADGERLFIVGSPISKIGYDE